MCLASLLLDSITCKFHGCVVTVVLSWIAFTNSQRDTFKLVTHTHARSLRLLRAIKRTFIDARARGEYSFLFLWRYWRACENTYSCEVGGNWLLCYCSICLYTVT